MAVGKEIGLFEMKSTSITLEAARGRVTSAQVNFEGDISGEFACTALATMTVESSDGQDGTYTICARCFMQDGEVLDAVGEGKTTSTGGQRWTVAGVAKMSNGRATAVKGEIDLARRTYTGRLFERH